MKLVRVFGLLAAVLVLSPFAFADGGTVNMQFVGVNGVNDGQYYVSPYNGTMNGQNVVLFCDDVKNEINFGQMWTASVTDLGVAIATTTSTNNGFANTRYGGVNAPGNSVFGNAIVDYQAAAYLVSLLATDTNPSDMITLQHALWDIMNPGSYADGTSLANSAINAVINGTTNINPYSFEIITNVGPLSLTGQEQEFIVQTPEPSSLALMVCGALALAFVAFTRARLSA